MSEPGRRAVPTVLTLGTLGVTDGTRRGASTFPRRRKPFCLLVYLLTARSADGFHERSSLCALLWPESDERRARSSLRQAIRTIERSLGDVIQRRGVEEIRVRPGALDVDTRAFEGALDDGRLAEAVQRYRGPFLDGVHLRGAPTFARWADLQQLRLAARYRSALDSLASGHAWGGGSARPASFWDDLARAAPHDASAAQALAEAAERMGEDPQRAERVATPPAVDRVGPEPASRGARVDAPKRQRRRSLVAVLVLVALGVAGAFTAGRRTEADAPGPLRVAVPSFEVGSGSDMEPARALALIVADEIGRVDSVEVIPFHILEDAVGRADDRGGRIAGSAFASAGAELIVRGSIVPVTPSETTLVLDLIDLRSGEELGPSIVARQANTDVARMASDAGRRAATRIADAHAPPNAVRGGHARSSRPPVLQAYLAFAEALEAFAAGDIAGAERHAARALEHDPTFVAAKVEIAIQRVNRRDHDGAERLYREVVDSDVWMSAWDRNRLDWLGAVLRGDRAERVRIATERTPRMTRFQRAYELSNVGRLTESMQVLDERGPEPARPEFRWREFWMRTVNLHRLGRHDEELREATRYATEFDENDQPLRLQARALAASGRVSDLERLVARAEEAAIPYAAARVAHEAGIELLAHGWNEEGSRWMERALDGYPLLSGTGSPLERWRAEALSAVGRWDEARDAFRTLLELAPDDASLQAELAIVEARSGFGNRARAALERLQDGHPATSGDRAVLRARIAAALNDDEGVEALLAIAGARGAARPGWSHAFPEWRFLEDRSVLASWLEVR